MVTSVKGIKGHKDLDGVFELKNCTVALTLSRWVTVALTGCWIPVVPSDHGPLCGISQGMGAIIVE